MKTVVCFSLYILMLFSGSCWSSNPQTPSFSSETTPLTLFSSDTSGPAFIGVNMLHLKDEKHLENITTILGNDERSFLNWAPIRRASPNFGFTNTAYWFKFTIRNTSQNKLPVYIELPIPFLDDVALYRTKDYKIVEQQLVGDKYPFASRPVQHQNFIMPFTLDPGDNLMYMRVASAGTVEAPLSIWLPEQHAQATADDHFLQGIWTGIIGIMVIYNLLLFFSIKDVSYLYYVIFAFGYLMFQSSLKGYGFAYLWPNQLQWNSFAISTFIALGNLSVVMLVISFLKLKEQNPFAYRLMSGIAFIAGVLLILTFLVPYSFTVRMTSALTMITCIMSLTLGYISLYRGDPDARYFCLAWTATFIGIGILGTVKFGLLTANFWTNNAGQIGAVMLVSLLSFALANRFNREKELRLLAQESSLHSEKIARQSQEQLLQTKIQANDELEQKVEERTQIMQQALIELENVNTQLELASTTDALTTLVNRGHFESRLDIEYKRASRHSRELSAILCDIDHFKAINDTYGHKTGDDCLRNVALIFKNKITRTGDVVARYGGEEFIILLADTPLHEANIIAQSLCDEIRHTKLLAGQKEIFVTASFGVSSLLQPDTGSAEDLIHHADLALYQAKHNGRDQVVVWQTEKQTKTTKNVK